MDVILLERVAGLGQMGDVVKVKPGYARNYLLPQEKALRATKANRERFEGERVQREARNLETKREAEALAADLNGQIFEVIRQAGETGQLYGSVSAKDIADVATYNGFSVARSQVVLNTPIKNIGLHKVTIQLHAEVGAMVTINVARSTQEADRQAQGEDLSRRRDDRDEDDYINPNSVAIPGVPGTGEQPDA